MAPLLLALRFVLEVTLLGTLAWLGFRNVDNVVGATFVAVVVVALVGALWGLFLAPGAASAFRWVRAWSSNSHCSA